MSFHLYSQTYSNPSLLGNNSTLDNKAQILYQIPSQDFCFLLFPETEIVPPESARRTDAIVLSPGI